MKVLRIFTATVTLLCLASTALNAQQSQLLYRKDGPFNGSGMGKSVGGGKDVDGDGYGDFIIGAPDADSIFVYSGTNGSLLFRKGGQTGSNFGRSVALLGDATGDGKSEFIVGAPIEAGACGAAYVYSGADGSVLYYYQNGTQYDYFGTSVAPAGDVNSDGKADFIIGIPGYGQVNPISGNVLVYSGANGNILYSKQGASAEDKFGYSVSSGDINGDGKPDLIVGAPGTDSGAASNRGSVYVYSGVTPNNLLYQKNGAANGDQFGWSVDAGDVNGDSKSDFIVGAPTGAGSKGAAYVYSGLNGNLLYSKTGAASGDHFGSSVAVAGQIDQSGGEDFIVGAPLFNLPGKSDCGKVYLYSGSAGSLIWNYTGSSAGDQFGFAVNRGGQSIYCPDLCESVENFIIGAPNFGQWDSGAAFVWRIVYPPILKVTAGNLPGQFSLNQNYPNPFNANTNISFLLDAPARVELAVYNILGEKVRTLLSEERPAGTHEVAFDGRDDQRRTLSSGVYFYKLNAGDQVITKQMMLIK